MRAVPRFLLLGLCLAVLPVVGCDSGSLTPEDEDRIQLEAAMDCSVTMLALGATERGELNTGSCRTHGAGSYLSFYGLRIGEEMGNDYLLIDMAADGSPLNPYLILLSSDGQNQIAFNDDFLPPSSDARIRIRGLQPGLYAIVARTAVVGQTGNFSISVQRER